MRAGCDARLRILCERDKRAAVLGVQWSWSQQHVELGCLWRHLFIDISCFAMDVKMIQYRGLTSAMDVLWGTGTVDHKS